MLFVTLVAQGSFAQQSKRSFICKDEKAAFKSQWALIDDVKSLKLKPTGKFKLPKQFDVFKVSSNHLNQYLTDLRTKGGTLELPVPNASVSGGFDCVTFKMENSGTMSPELNAKYPQLVSLKGYALENKTNLIRYDYDGTSQKISITWNGINYLYTPYISNNKTYYLLFKKIDDNNSIKRTSF